MTDTLLDKLITVTMTSSQDKFIKHSEYKEILAEFAAIKNNWAKAAYLCFQHRSGSKSRKGAASKIIRELETTEQNYYQGTFRHYYEEVDMKYVMHHHDWIRGKMVDLMVEHGGDQDYKVVARALYHAGVVDVLKILTVTLTPDIINYIKKNY